ncbi:aminopeptidase [Membranihabitans maritimus]|uniref:aminopeptidase n=1 Tax=Membranihabitans maritimus TaxID=2904244 RepID=UPI001F238716|nr:aminopeptidase [Membranihabitans maritimus]
MTLLEKYAALLVDYCLEIKKNDRLFIKTTLLAEPLVKEIYKATLDRGGHLETEFIFEGQNKILFDRAKLHQIEYISPTTWYRFENFEKYLFIRAPYNLFEDKNIDGEKLKIRADATKPLNDLYFERTANGSMERSLCQFPTQASAQAAEMALDDYQEFVYAACKLYDKDPSQSWLQVRLQQQSVTDFLNQSKNIIYRGENIDISFSCSGRTWINSDGRANMPSGEVFTAPVEDSVNGEVYFSYPAIYRGNEVIGVRLTFKDGYITNWSAEKGQEVLNDIFKIEGARRLGEAAIGTNYNIQRITRNILFDEKIGGSIHLAVGQAYKQCGGKNRSSVHWDMITDMKKDGQIIADGKVIYERGKFLI